MARCAQLLRLALVALILAARAVAPAVGHAQPADERYFPQTQFRVDDDAFWDFFQHRGQVPTFGYPGVAQRQPGGGVQTRNLLDAGR
jgi:hypothetical protein